jgi:hypothetical protein
MAGVPPRKSSGGSWSAGRRGRVVVTKVGLEWRKGGDVVRNATRERIMKEKYREAALRAVPVARASRGVASVGRSGYTDDRHRC